MMSMRSRMNNRACDRAKVRAVLASLAVSGALALTGCSASEEIAEPAMTIVDKPADPTTVTETIEAEPEDDSHDDAAKSDKKKSSRDSGDCNTSPAADEIHRATAEVNEEYPNGRGGWVFTGRTNYDSCSDLSYALVTQAEQGNAQFGTLILMFHQGEYIGIDSIYPQQAMDVTPDGEGRFTVLYKDWEALHAAGAANSESPNYNSTVTYYWDGSKVAHEGRIPNTSFSPI